MLRQLYMVYDITAETVIGGIILEGSDGPAVRAFRDALATKESVLAQHPEDYNLLHLGSIVSDGKIITDGVRIVATGYALKELANA